MHPPDMKHQVASPVAAPVSKRQPRRSRFGFHGLHDFAKRQQPPPCARVGARTGQSRHPSPQLLHKRRAANRKRLGQPAARALRHALSDVVLSPPPIRRRRLLDFARHPFPQDLARQPRRRRRVADIGRVGTPAVLSQNRQPPLDRLPLRRSRHGSRPLRRTRALPKPQRLNAHRVQVQIDAARQRPGAFAVYRNAPVPSLEELTATPVPRVKPVCVTHVHPLQGATRISLRRFDQHVVVVSHQHVSVQNNPIPHRQLPHQLDKMPPVAVVLENLAPPHPARRDVIPPATGIASQMYVPRRIEVQAA
jgi:hypothetical protein